MLGSYGLENHRGDAPPIRPIAIKGHEDEMAPLSFLTRPPHPHSQTAQKCIPRVEALSQAQDRHTRGRKEARVYGQRLFGMYSSRIPSGMT